MIKIIFNLYLIFKLIKKIDFNNTFMRHYEVNAENTYTPNGKKYQNSSVTEIAIFYYKIYVSKLVSTLNIKNCMNINNIKTK